MMETDTHKTKGLLPLAPQGNFEKILVNLAHFVSLPTQVLFRKEFGKRYLRVFNTSFLSFTLYVLWLGVFLLAPVMLGKKELVLSWFYLLIVAIFSSIHAFEIYRRPKRGVKIHSQYTGYPRLMDVMPDAVKAKLKEWDFTPEIFVKMYLEPAICFLAAWLIFGFDPLLSLLVGSGGASLYLCGQYQYARDEDKLLDILDGEIEAGMLQEDLDNSRSVKNFGVESYAAAPRAKVVSSKAKTAKPGFEEEDGMPQLPLELRNLVNEEDDDDEPALARPQATVKIGTISSRKEENLVDSTTPRPRGRPRKEAYP
jgi:hypothetical protein